MTALVIDKKSSHILEDGFQFLDWFSLDTFSFQNEGKFYLETSISLLLPIVHQYLQNSIFVFVLNIMQVDITDRQLLKYLKQAREATGDYWTTMKKQQQESKSTGT